MWCRGASGGCSRPWRWPPTSTPCGASSPTTSGSPTSSPTSFTTEGFRARIRVGYGSNRGGCSKLCTGTSRRASFWISRRSQMQLMDESSTSPWLMVALRSSRENGPSDLVRGHLVQFCCMKLVIPRFNFPALFLERIIRLNNFRNATTDDAISSNKFKEAPPSGFGGVLASPSSELDGKWGVYGNVCRLDRPCVEHEGAHRFVFASITVNAPVRDVWDILTAYEKLPEFVPNLAISRIILRDNNKVRMLQEGCKGLLYMVLHARVVMDLREKLEREISFEQVEGDFYSFKGKWQLEQLGDQHTLLKYMVETKMHKDTFLSESILEEVIYEDLPSNLCAIHDYIENAESESGNSKTRSCVPTNTGTVAIDYAKGRQSEQASVSCSSSPVKQRPKVPGLQKDIEVLKSELKRFIAKYGQDGFMPKRKHLRSHGRVDIEKAITRMVYSKLTVTIVYRSGRYDIARALEKWGGVQEVSRFLSLELRRPRRRANSDDESKAESPNAVTNKHASKQDNPNVSPDKQKWLLKLKDLDADWVEY
ncbi:hypothetical protein ABZP36_006114 [Zizania latifolia]